MSSIKLGHGNLSSMKKNLGDFLGFKSSNENFSHMKKMTFITVRLMGMTVGFVMVTVIILSVGGMALGSLITKVLTGQIILLVGILQLIKIQPALLYEQLGICK